MEVHVGGVEIAKSQELLDEYYENLEFVPEDTLREIYLKVTLFRTQKVLDTCVKPERFLTEVAKRASHYTPVYYIEMNTVCEFLGDRFWVIKEAFISVFGD